MNIWLIKIQKILKEFLTKSSKYDIIHTVRNEASDKVSEILEKGFKKETRNKLKKVLDKCF